MLTSDKETPFAFSSLSLDVISTISWKALGYSLT